MLIITTLAATALAALQVRLALGVIKHRQQFKVSIGDGGEDLLARAMRAHGNSAEYIPIGLILLGCLEFNRAPLWVITVLAVAFVVGRYLHPIGIKTAEASHKPRVLGMQLTLFSIVAMIAINLGWLAWTLAK